MNECNKRFLEKNGIVIEDVCEKVDCHIYSNREINYITAHFGFQKEDKIKNVSIADVVGYDTQTRHEDTNIFLSMDRYFAEDGSPYSSRSIGMLEYDKENIIEKLKQSFAEEPMSITETGEGTYTILYNGLHRYTLLRALYLAEAASANGNKEKLEELYKKYTIPAKVTGVDINKTYCKYLLDKVKTDDKEWNIMDIYTEYDSNNKMTGNVMAQYGNGEKEALSDKMLVLLTRDRIAEDERYMDNYETLQMICDNYPSFAKFIRDNFADIIPLQTKDIDKERNDN